MLCCGFDFSGWIALLICDTRNHPREDDGAEAEKIVLYVANREFHLDRLVGLGIAPRLHRHHHLAGPQDADDAGQVFRLIGVRRRYPVFGRGSYDTLHPANMKIIVPAKLPKSDSYKGSAGALDFLVWPRIDPEDELAGGVEFVHREPDDGRIALQVHGGGDYTKQFVRYRNVRVKVLVGE